MGLLNAFLDWQSAKHEKKLEKMKEQNLCPVCNGRGYYLPEHNGYTYIPSFDYQCYGCDGNGSYTSWQSSTQ
ncbi:methionine aminopeptidase [Bacillus sp. FJAT-45350]|uniref:methionine aminopeptidase n=1 Tax=Bacillus sp. FJAT-45350 TaxID=2011014 RepID=UPI000BB7528B|nr:methionine aminopeptidase [Bacillus sp. FJAT-45350]